jgi:hypothetical protein
MSRAVECDLIDGTVVVEKPDSSNIYLHTQDGNVDYSEKLFFVYQIAWRPSRADSNTDAGPEDDKSYDNFLFMFLFK